MRAESVKGLGGNKDSEKSGTLQLSADFLNTLGVPEKTNNQHDNPITGSRSQYALYDCFTCIIPKSLRER